MDQADQAGVRGGGGSADPPDPPLATGLNTTKSIDSEVQEMADTTGLVLGVNNRTVRTTCSTWRIACLFRIS